MAELTSQISIIGGATVIYERNIYHLARMITNLVTVANVRGFLRMLNVVDCAEMACAYPEHSRSK